MLCIFFPSELFIQKREVYYSFFARSVSKCDAIYFSTGFLLNELIDDSWPFSVHCDVWIKRFFIQTLLMPWASYVRIKFFATFCLGVIFFIRWPISDASDVVSDRRFNDTPRENLISRWSLGVAQLTELFLPVRVLFVLQFHRKFVVKLLANMYIRDG